MARIELRNIVRTFGGQHAVQNLDMTIEDGELLVLLGPSGCGKSTTMNMIAGLDSPTSGQILFDGVDVTQRSPHERNIAMVFQSSLLYPHLSARDNIYMSLKRSGLSKQQIEARIAHAAETVDVTRLLDKRPSQLSGGERQRVATAKAIVREPAGFLLDEPLSALDAALRLSLRAELVNLQKRIRTTMIFVTHDQIEAMTMGDRIGVMRQGRLEQIGTPTDIYNRPETLFVAGFVGTPPMNFLKGSLEQIDGKLWLVNPSIRMEIKGEFASAKPMKNVVLGIRPHLMRLSEAGSSALPLTVYAIEQLGNEAIVICDGPAGEKIRVVTQAGFTAPIGARLDATFDSAAARLYDPATERVVATDGAN
ncbi:MAG: ABC transporter ATP-binding protein [Rhizobiales bacterium]|nr:ABC transporter ATP-binding protein [Hyphomicrobiales bacterium]